MDNLFYIDNSFNIQFIGSEFLRKAIIACFPLLRYIDEASKSQYYKGILLRGHNS